MMRHGLNPRLSQGREDVKNSSRDSYSYRRKGCPTPNPGDPCYE